MIRRGGGTTWGSRGSPTLYGQRGSRGPGRWIVVGGAALVIIILAYFVLRSCGGSSCADPYCPSGEDPPVPEGYTRITKVYEFNRKTTGPLPSGFEVQAQLPVEGTTSDGRNLGFFSFVPATRNWEPLTPAILDQSGTHVSATLNTAPRYIAVLRRLSAAGHVIAYVPHNGQLHPDAVKTITILHTRDFRPASDGGILGDLTDFALTGVKTDGSVALFPVITADSKELTPIVSGILANSVTRSAHVQQIVKKVVESNLAGIDVAYTELAASERTSFTLFVTELAQALHQQNKRLSLTVPAPLKTAERVDEGAYDWAELGRAADILQMAPYRDQSTLRRDMPAILDYLSTVVQPLDKLVLTVSPYATEKTPDGINVLTLTAAMSIATKMGLLAGADSKLTTNSNVNIQAFNIDTSAGRTGITWQSATATVAFSYEQNGGRTIWLENVFSIGFKLEYISRYKLGGVAVEDATSNVLLGNIWTALVPFVNGGQPLLLQPNPQDLIPQWKVSAGTSEGGQKGVLSWATPAEPGTYTVSLTLSDGASLFENEIPITVQAKDKPTTPTVSPTAASR